MIKIDIKKRLLGAFGAIEFELNHTFNHSDFWAVFGESGVGKTTLLRIIAGLEEADSGIIEVEGKIWFDSEKKINLSPQKREVGFVFQDYALFENKSVIENILYAQKIENETKAKEILQKMRLSDLANRKPSSLSGGQKQRVALARAIAQEPKILLLDEPLSALDYITRSALQDELKTVHNMFKLTTLLVSHDRSEVFKLSDFVLWIKNGKVFNFGKVKDVFLPKNISNEFSLLGEIISIEERENFKIAIIVVGQNIIEVKLNEDEAKNYKITGEVMIVLKEFNPTISPIS